MCVYIYIYIERERERKYTHTHTHTYTPGYITYIIIYIIDGEGDYRG